MIVRLTGALLRALLVALVIATPALLLPEVEADSAQVVALMALIAGTFVFLEYFSRYPSIIEFRFAPPFNRLRFFAIFAVVLLLTVSTAGDHLETPVAALFRVLGTIFSQALDFPYSPVHLVLLALPEGTPPAEVAMVRDAAGISYLVALCALLVFAYLVKVKGWPGRYGAFNVWINLPLFDPTGGGDVLNRLKRDSVVNVVLGILLPFLTPAAFKLATFVVGPVSITDPMTLIWTLTAWSLIPANLVMRGIALMRIADMIEQKRRRTYAEARTEEQFQAA
ncbi:membrane protein [Oceanicola sp. 22II-s10i]|uniref:hypothetical protein n=1 Tax=Oceanicola sp. 22II-s10i TaxID=1317116 RepID=UPI000B52524E|nr:hypothetical protein [Oceanicola sp. 22II-s10i]OWU86165.1 membrane protein [Oceanicola sp. 22II-s10i]